MDDAQLYRLLSFLPVLATRINEMSVNTDAFKSALDNLTISVLSLSQAKVEAVAQVATLGVAIAELNAKIAELQAAPPVVITDGVDAEIPALTDAVNALNASVAG